METIHVRAEFHTAHRQIQYPGQCRFIHGHTWRGEIIIRCERFPRDACDMTLEFGTLKAIFKNLDHKILVTADDPELLDVRRFEPDGVVLIPGRGPSVENVAAYAFGKVVEQIRAQYPDHGLEYEITVVIHETAHNTFSISDRVLV